MSKLKLATIEDDKPVKLTIELPAAVHRNLCVCGSHRARDGRGLPIQVKSSPR